MRETKIYSDLEGMDIVRRTSAPRPKILFGVAVEEFTIWLTNRKVKRVREEESHFEYLIQRIKGRGVDVIDPVRAPDFDGSLRVQIRL